MLPCTNSPFNVNLHPPKFTQQLSNSKNIVKRSSKFRRHFMNILNRGKVTSTTGVRHLGVSKLQICLNNHSSGRRLNKLKVSPRKSKIAKCISTKHIKSERPPELIDTSQPEFIRQYLNVSEDLNLTNITYARDNSVKMKKPHKSVMNSRKNKDITLTSKYFRSKAKLCKISAWDTDESPCETTMNY